MTWMRGARRHWPAAVTDTDRDMSRELNTGKRTEKHITQSMRCIRKINMYPSGIVTQRESPHTHQRLFMHTHTEPGMNFSWINQVALKLTKSNTQLTLAYWKKKRSREEAATWTLTGLSDSLSASIIHAPLSFACHPCSRRSQIQAQRASVHCRGVVSCYS